LLFELGASGVQEDWLPGEEPPARQPWDTGPVAPLPARQVLVAWFEDADEQRIVRSLPDVVSSVTWSDVPDVDWSTRWREGLEPIRITDRLVIAPPWDVPEGALIIEPGQGFGSGTHHSTQGALRLLDPLFDTHTDLLDVGCGSGILALAAARHGLAIRGIDVEEAAIRDAHHNAKLNGLSGDFDTTPLHRLTGTWQLVAGNLHAELIVRLADDLVRVTGGWFVCAGILADREHLVRDVLDHRLVLDKRVPDGEWVALRYRRA
jgi:ribosomal protein L11 methyltransferase